MSIKIKMLTDLYDSSINDFYNAFHNENRSKEAFNWEFVDTPASQAVYIHALDENEKIVGAISVLFLEIINGKGEKVLTGKPEDVMVDVLASIKHRKVDIFKNLYEVLEKECIRRNVSILWGFTYASSSFKRLGFESVLSSNSGVLVLNPFRSYKYLVSLNSENRISDKFKIAILTVLSYIGGSRLVLNSSKIEGEIVEGDFVDHNNLVSNHLDSNAEFYCLNQDEDFINWRLHNNPHSITYKSLELRSNSEEKLAEIIYSLNGEVAYIEQLLLGNSLSRKTVSRFLKYSVLRIKMDNVSLIRFMGFGTNPYNIKEMDSLKRLGFLFTNKGIPFIFKNLSEDSCGIGSKNLFLTRLYTQGNI